MSSKNSQTKKKKTVKELNDYTDSLETRIIQMEELFKLSGIDVNNLQDKIKADSENVKRIDKLEKRINSIDKRVKHFENTMSEQKQKHETSNFKCTKCSDKFLDEKKLKDHIATKHSQMIKCRFCSETFQQTWMLEKHISIHIEKQFNCDECSQNFHLKWRFMKHKEGHKKVDAKFCHFFNNSDKCPFEELGCMFRHEISPQCKYIASCNRKLCQYQHKSGQSKVPSVSKHVGVEHSDNEKDLEDTLEETILPNQNCHDCSQCEQTFIKKELLKLHIESEHSKLQYPCEKCLYTFDSEDNFTTHLSGTEHNLKKVDDYSEDSEDEDYSDSCRHCGKVFTTYETFDNHQDSYLQCNECKVCFHNEFQWDDHENCDRYS